MTTVERILRVRADEKSAVLWASAYAFSIFLSYYILRPVRDEISAADRGNVHLIWTAVFLAMLVGNDAVTCVIPGTAKTQYAIDNLGAARGRLPNSDQRKKMEEFHDSLTP